MFLELLKNIAKVSQTFSMNIFLFSIILVSFEVSRETREQNARRQSDKAVLKRTFGSSYRQIYNSPAINHGQYVVGLALNNFYSKMAVPLHSVFTGECNFLHRAGRNII